MTRHVARSLLPAFLLLALACSGGDGGSDAGADAAPDAPADVPADVPADAALPDLPAGPGTCRYAGPASEAPECKAYGEGWTREAAQADCAAVQPGIAGTFGDDPCPAEGVLGTCRWGGAGSPSHAVVTSGGDPFRCNPVRTLCLSVGGGTFEAGPECAGLGAPTANWGETPFVHPYRICVPARDGEAPGTTDGKVCTWTLISGCTEPGRRFEDYGYCPDVISQRPYGASSASPTKPDDPRLADTAYMAEVDWAAKQVEACGCACCHTKRLAPKGPANWYTDAPGIWTDGIRNTGLALMVNLADSRALGAFPPGDNNGFDRTQLGLPTSDVPRMRAFLQAEWERRELTEEFGRSVPAFGGPLVEQFTFVPEACSGGEGIEADGEAWWGGIDARYLFVMEADAKGPVVPPNLFGNEGTLWMVTVPNVKPAFADAVYGQVQGDQRQVVPAQGAPPALVSGRDYYLVALVDVGLPAMRCLFTAP